MKSRLLTRVPARFALLWALVLVTPGSSAAQRVEPGVREAYLRAVADHFKLPVNEVTIVADWGLEPDEVPVVLFLSGMAGVSSDALIGLRRSGRSWMDIARRFGLDAVVFHLDLPDGSPLGVLERAYGEFRSRPAGEWSQINLGDEEIVALVNMRVLSACTHVAPLRILRGREEAGSFAAAFVQIRGG